MGGAHRPVSRRAFLRGLGGAAAGAALWSSPWSGELWTPARAEALRRSLAFAVNPGGTTLEATIVAGVEASAAGTYRRLTDGPGWPILERADLAGLQRGREDRRVALASFVQLTDVHVVDAQSPGRVEFLDRYGEPYTAAFRPQETLTTQVQASMVQRINRVARGPVTGRPFDAVVSTGDNIDNQQHNELDWFIGVLNGGELRANSGAPDRYEGVQSIDWDLGHYWQPDAERAAGEYGTVGFPSYPGLLDAAIGPFRSEGLDVPWFSTYGNHDGLIQGNLPTSEAADAIFTGTRKLTDLPEGTPPLAFVGDMFGRIAEIKAGLDRGAYPSRDVTADERRRTVKTREWVQAHLDRPGRVGPAGHGYDESHLEAPALFYAFDLAPGVRALSLDTGGFNSGSLGESQMAWLEAELQRAHSRWFGADGREVRGSGTDQLVVLFSHFTIGTMKGSLPDPERPGERRVQGAELVAFLQRYPNVVAWVNGHTHTNTISAVPDPSGRTDGFWEITTASHVDWPEQCRTIEIVDNRDGTISIFCVLLEHAAPATTDAADRSLLGLAAISRELAFNDVGVGQDARLGPVEARNVELALRAPFDLQAAGITGAAPAWRSAGAGPGGSTPGGSTPSGSTPGAGSAASGSAGAASSGSGVPVPALVGGGAVLVGAGVAGALALRRRGEAGGGDTGRPDDDGGGS